MFFIYEIIRHGIYLLAEVHNICMRFLHLTLFSFSCNCHYANTCNLSDTSETSVSYTDRKSRTVRRGMLRLFSPLSSLPYHHIFSYWNLGASCNMTIWQEKIIGQTSTIGRRTITVILSTITITWRSLGPNQEFAIHTSTNKFNSIHNKLWAYISLYKTPWKWNIGA